MSENESSEWISNGIRFRTESNEDGSVKCFADFSGFVRDMTDLMSNQMTDEILEGCEAELNRHGWFKEKTCKGCAENISRDNSDECIWCARNPLYTDCYIPKVVK